MKLIMENWKRFLDLNERYKGDRDVDSGKKPMKLVITNYMPNGFNLTAEVDFRKNKPKQNRVELLKAIKVLKVPQGQPVVVASMKMPDPAQPGAGPRLHPDTLKEIDASLGTAFIAAGAGGVASGQHIIDFLKNQKPSMTTQDLRSFNQLAKMMGKISVVQAKFIGY